SRRRHTRSLRDWSSDVCSSDLVVVQTATGTSIPVRVNLVPNDPGVRSITGPNNPPKAGDTVQILVTGLGAVTPALADGAAAPTNPPVTTVVPAVLRMGGQLIEILSS